MPPGRRPSAVREGDYYVINGTKNFITNGPQSGSRDRVCDDRSVEGQQGISGFIVETSTPGWQVTRDRRQDGDSRRA